jgi:hypothetical protein
MQNIQDLITTRFRHYTMTRSCPSIVPDQKYQIFKSLLITLPSKLQKKFGLIFVLICTEMTAVEEANWQGCNCNCKLFVNFNVCSQYCKTYAVMKPSLNNPKVQSIWRTKFISECMHPKNKNLTHVTN